MDNILATLHRIKEVTDEVKLIDAKIASWEESFSHHEHPQWSASAAAVGELHAKIMYIRMMCEQVIVTPLQIAVKFASAFERELGKRKLVEPTEYQWYHGGYISVEPSGDNGNDDFGFDLIESMPSKDGVKRQLITDIGVMKIDGNWQVVNNENTLVDAEELIDWLEGKGD